MSIALPLPPPSSRRPAGLALTILVHVALLLGWKMAQWQAPASAEPEPAAVQWLRVPASVVVAPVAPRPLPTPAAGPGRRAPAASRPQPAGAAAATPATTAPAAAPAASAPPVTATPTDGPAAGAESGVLQRALRAADGIDRALRKENNPYIVAPLDSPQIRMRRGMQAAADLAPGKWYEAPKVEELVNNTGDGARRTRVVTGNGTYCVTERATNTSIDMIEKHGKLRLTNSPAHETPASAQAWRTARD
jgi:hypothetical protein